MQHEFNDKEAVRMYEQVLDCSVNAPLGIEDINQIIESGDYFKVPVRGLAARARLNVALQTLKHEIANREHSSDEADALRTGFSELLKDRIEKLKANELLDAKARDKQKDANFKKPETVSDDQWRALVQFLTAFENENARGTAYYEAHLFGSLARGRAQAGSDLDIAIVSETFIGVPWERRIARLKKIAPKTGFLINPVGLTTEEFESYDYPTIIRSIRNASKPIF